MAKVFLDTNIFIDAIHRVPEKHILDDLEGHIIYTSVLSFHIYCYTFKIKIPNPKALNQKTKFQIIDFSNNILDKALEGPTADLEDNIQLHSAAEVECDILLTEDQKLLNMKFFGKTKIAAGTYKGYK
ncbi:type II toxin-antitoxin system VapC family toxin [Candidatus Daviesbacteria bacterium]|nr:type II toxin-antitoxin system VapC family toxin [Candidatus Daviesbacteria bacterium]